MKQIKLFLVAALIAAVFAKCEKEKAPSVDYGFSRGVYIVNEGSFTQNNGSISFFDTGKDLIVNDVFQSANNRPLGDIVQSMAVVNDSLGYIVVNNSGKVEIVSLKTFQAIAVPIQTVYPRYIAQVSSNKAYLTAGSLQGNVVIIDLSSNTVSGTIQVGFGPEAVFHTGNKAYIANSGGWGADSTISVINTVSDEVEDIIYVGKNPTDLALDAEDHIWVYCKGFTNYSDIETDSFIQKIDPTDNSIVWQAKVGGALDYMMTPAKCTVSDDGKIVYYLRPDGIYEINAANPVLNNNPLIEGNFYGLDVNPENGDIYVFESSFNGNGTMKIYDPDGTLISQGTVGIGPNGAVFNLR